MESKKTLEPGNSQLGITDSQLSNVYHILPNSSFYRMPDCHGLHPYQRPVFNIRDAFVPHNFNDHSLMNPQLFGFHQPLQVAQLPTNLPPQWSPAGSMPNLVDNINNKTKNSFSQNRDGCSQQAINELMNQDKDMNKQRKKKFKKRSIQEQLPKKEWKKEDADLALKVESEFGSIKKRQQIIIKFPDEELSADIVKKFHSSIKFVHFQTACGPRYCFAQIDENEDVDSVITDLNLTEFQNGFLKAERKIQKEEEELSPEEIDPYTLYLGNLPQSITSNTVKEKFKKASRIDIGFAQKIKFTRYAFIRFKNVQDAVEAYKENVDIIIDNRSVVLRFRRLNTAHAHKETDATRKKIKLEETANGSENQEPPVPGETNEEIEQISEEHTNKNYENVEVKSEPVRGYSDENDMSKNFQPIFGTLFKKKDGDIVKEIAQCLQNMKNVKMNGVLPLIQYSVGSEANEKSDSSPLAEFVSHLTGVPCVSPGDAELFKSVIFKLSDIFKNTKIFSASNENFEN